jgi:predicted glycosyltransferase
MKIWIDLATSPHVPLFVPVARALQERGNEVVLTARDHAQTLPRAIEVWPGIVVTGASSPAGRLRKGGSILSRSAGLWRFARTSRPDLALSHGSYTQIVAARVARMPAVTMMDYQH